MQLACGVIMKDCFKVFLYLPDLNSGLGCINK